MKKETGQKIKKAHTDRMKDHDQQEVASNAPPPYPSKEDGMAKCILIYEDDQEILFLCKTILTKNKYQVEALSRCEHVISDIDRLKPDLILMDLWIPNIGGERAISLIKAIPALGHIPILLFSANADIKDICQKINADGYIAKPFDVRTLLEVIGQHIS